MNIAGFQSLVIGFLALLLFSQCKDEKMEQSKIIQVPEVETKKVEYALVIHGGAGTILKENMTEELEQAYRDKLQETLNKGQEILSRGGSAMDAVEACIHIMENSPLFNAGKGAVFTHQATNELDASIMRGSDLAAGAVGGVTHIKNPISAARAVLEKSEHVMMIGAGAEEFAKLHNIEMVETSYFHTQKRFDSLQKILEREATYGSTITALADSKFGTVGAVALDQSGNIVAGTSTGGMTNKKFNRIGDSPIIGAGTYANNITCGVSCTGHGEYFIRYAVAHDVSAMMEYTGKSLEEVSNYIINEKLKNAGGEGGLIALDKHGNIAMPFNSKGMYRAFVTNNASYVGIYEED